MSAPTEEQENQQTCLVPYLEADDAPPEVAVMLKGMPYRRNLMHLLAHAHGVYPRLLSVYLTLFDDTRRILPQVDWWLIALRIPVVLDAKYQWEANEPVARLHGMSEEKVAAIERTAPALTAGKLPEDNVELLEKEEVFTPRDRAILRMVDEQLLTYDNLEETVKLAREYLSVEELVELYIVLGEYALVGRITKGLRCDLDGEIPGIKEKLKKVEALGK